MIEGGIWVVEEMCESIMRRRPGRRIVSISRIISRNKHLTIYFIGRRISYGQMPIDRNIEQCANSHGWRPSASVYGGERRPRNSCRKKKMFAGFSLHSINHSVAAPSDPQSFSRSFAPLFRYIYIYIICACTYISSPPLNREELTTKCIFTNGGTYTCIFSKDVGEFCDAHIRRPEA